MKFTAYTAEGIMGGQVNTILGTLLLSSVALGACLLMIRMSVVVEQESYTFASDVAYADLLK